MSGILVDHYTSLITEAQTSSKILLELAGAQVVFYVTKATHELRVRAFGSPRITTLLQGVRQCHGFIHNGSAHVYLVMMNGSMQLRIYKSAVDVSPQVHAVPFPKHVVHVHTLLFGMNFLMVLDDGIDIHLMASQSVNFAGAHHHPIYRNSMDPSVYASYPVVGVHPGDFNSAPDPSVATVALQVKTIATGEMNVAFFPVTVDLV